MSQALFDLFCNIGAGTANPIHALKTLTLDNELFSHNCMDDVSDNAHVSKLFVAVDHNLAITKNLSKITSNIKNYQIFDFDNQKKAVIWIGNKSHELIIADMHDPIRVIDYPHITQNRVYHSRYRTIHPFKREGSKDREQQSDLYEKFSDISRLTPPLDVKTMLHFIKNKDHFSYQEKDDFIYSTHISELYTNAAQQIAVTRNINSKNRYQTLNFQIFDFKNDMKAVLWARKNKIGFVEAHMDYNIPSLDLKVPTYNRYYHSCYEENAALAFQKETSLTVAAYQPEQSNKHSLRHR
jgi:hypothetical protein